MRIATSQFYTQNIELMNNQESQISTLYQQVASGNLLQTPADNPLGAAQAVQLSATSATLSQYSANQNTALSALGLEDSTLSSVTGTLNSIVSRLSSAINGTMSDSDRAALASQLQGQRDTLLSLANTTDGAGNYIFAGFQGSSQPFTNSPAGGVTFSGDTGQRNVQISDTLSVAQGDSGVNVFLSVPSTGSLPVPTGAAGNTGTGTIGAVTAGKPGDPTNNHAYTITFGGTSTAPTYTVTDNSTTPPTTGAAQAYQAGSAIQVGSQSLVISGSPNAGDSFSLTPAPAAGADIFGALDAAIAALKAPVGSDGAATASFVNSMSTALTKVNNSLANITTVQASVGGRETEVKAMQTITSSNALVATNSLSDLQQADMPTAISQLLQVQNALTAAQKAFSQVQNLSPRGVPAVPPVSAARRLQPGFNPQRASSLCHPFLSAAFALRTLAPDPPRRRLARRPFPTSPPFRQESPRWPIPISRAGAWPSAAPIAWSRPTSGCPGRRWWRWACSTWWRCSARPCSRRC